jgi:hypothetical protein
MKVKYEHGLAEVVVVGVGPVPRNQEVEVPDDLGRVLVTQGWVEVNPVAASSQSTANTTVKADEATASERVEPTHKKGSK